MARTHEGRGPMKCACYSTGGIADPNVKPSCRPDHRPVWNDRVGMWHFMRMTPKGWVPVAAPRTTYRLGPMPLGLGLSSEEHRSHVERGLKKIEEHVKAGLRELEQHKNCDQAVNHYGQAHGWFSYADAHEFSAGRSPSTGWWTGKLGEYAIMINSLGNNIKRACRWAPPADDTRVTGELFGRRRHGRR